MPTHAENSVGRFFSTSSLRVLIIAPVTPNTQKDRGGTISKLSFLLHDI